MQDLNKSENSSSKKMYDSQASRGEGENYQFMGLIEDIAGASGVSGSLYGRIQEPSLQSEPSVRQKIEANRSLLKSIDFVTEGQAGSTQQEQQEDRIILSKPPIQQKIKIAENNPMGQTQKLNNFQTIQTGGRNNPFYFRSNQDLTGSFQKEFGDDYIIANTQQFQTVRQLQTINQPKMSGRSGSQTATTGRSRQDELAIGLMTLGNQEENLQQYLVPDGDNQDFQVPEDNNSLISDIQEHRYGTIQQHYRHGPSVLDIPRSSSQQRLSSKQPSRSSGITSASKKLKSEKYLSLDLEHLHDLLANKSEWINIQGTLKQSIGYLLNIAVQQQNQINMVNDSMERVAQHEEIDIRVNQIMRQTYAECIKYSDFQQLQNKFELQNQDLITKFQLSLQRDLKDQNTLFSKNINKVIGLQKSQIHELQQNCQKFQTQVLDSLDIVYQIRQSQDTTQSETNKKLTTVFREVERMQTQLLSKATYDDIQNMGKNMAEKNWVKSNISQMVTKTEVDKMLKTKIDHQDLKNQINCFEVSNQEFREQLREDVFSELNQDYDEKMQKFKMHIHDFVSTQNLKTTNVFDEKLFVIEQKIQDVMKIKSEDSNIDFQFDELKTKIDLLEREMKKQEKQQLTSSNDFLQNLVDQLKEIETREANMTKQNNEKFTDILTQIKSINTSLTQDTMKFEKLIDDKVFELKNSIPQQMANQFSIEDRFDDLTCKFSDELDVLRQENQDIMIQISQMEQNSQNIVKNYKCDLSAMQVNEKSEKGMLQEQIIKLLQQRKDDLEMITEVLQKHQKGTSEQFEKLKFEHKKQQNSQESMIIQKVRDAFMTTDYKLFESKIKNSLDFRDFVRVAEVQDALKKLMETFQRKLSENTSQVEKLNTNIITFRQDMEQNQAEYQQSFYQQFQALKDDNLKIMLNQKYGNSQTHSQEPSYNVAENIQYNQMRQLLDNVIEKVYAFQKDIAMKASLKEVLDLVDAKTNDNEQLFESVNSTYEQFVAFRDTQNNLNSKLCANNCVARWLFKFDFINKINANGFDIYDLLMAQTSVNACEENYIWTKNNYDTNGNLLPASETSQKICVVMPGLYEIQMALVFQSEERPREMRILVNDNIAEVFQLYDEPENIKIFDSSEERNYKTDEEDIVKKKSNTPRFQNSESGASGNHQFQFLASKRSSEENVSSSNVSVFTNMLLTAKCSLQVQIVFSEGVRSKHSIQGFLQLKKM